MSLYVPWFGSRVVESRANILGMWLVEVVEMVEMQTRRLPGKPGQFHLWPGRGQGL